MHAMVEDLILLGDLGLWDFGQQYFYVLEQELIFLQFCHCGSQAGLLIFYRIFFFNQVQHHVVF
jgi:hypothetical protein